MFNSTRVDAAIIQLSRTCYWRNALKHTLKQPHPHCWNITSVHFASLVWLVFSSQGNQWSRSFSCTIGLEAAVFGATFGKGKDKRGWKENDLPYCCDIFVQGPPRSFSPSFPCQGRGKDKPGLSHFYICHQQLQEGEMTDTRSKWTEFPIHPNKSWKGLCPSVLIAPI